MSIGSNSTAIAVNTLVRFLLSYVEPNGALPSSGEARKAAKQLADAAYKFLHAGISGEQVDKHWPLGRECRCTKCGCTDSKACAGGCSWATVDRDAGTGVCSTCGTARKKRR